MKSRLEVLFVPVNERYTVLAIDAPAKQLDIIPDMPRLCKIALNGCESPLTFVVEMLEQLAEGQGKPDLVIYLSTEEREPSSERNMKVADRKRKFKFYEVN